MNLKRELQKLIENKGIIKYSEFERMNHHLYLNIEIDTKIHNMSSIVEVSKIISNYLAEEKTIEKKYILNIYSSKQ